MGHKELETFLFSSSLSFGLCLGFVFIAREPHAVFHLSPCWDKHPDDSWILEFVICDNNSIVTTFCFCHQCRKNLSTFAVQLEENTFYNIELMKEICFIDLIVELEYVLLQCKLYY